jgi:hypothetical protein
MIKRPGGAACEVDTLLIGYSGWLGMAAAPRSDRRVRRDFCSPDFNRNTLAIKKVLGCNGFDKNAYLLILCGKPHDGVPDVHVLARQFYAS